MKKQIALCIGNQDYNSFEKLSCAVNDCRCISKRLTTLGFDVLSYENLSRPDMFSVAGNFEEHLSEYDVALFYYAGHGFEVDGKNLLVPVDVPVTDMNELKHYQAFVLDEMIEHFQKHENLATKIIILDACRTSTLTRGAALNKFAPVFAPQGTIIAFSTSQGQSAIERAGNGAYTKALLQSIDLPRIPIENMFKHVREILAADTNGRQISWEHTSLIGNYYFNEDRIDAFSVYAAEVFCDANYYFNTENPLYNIIQALKSHDWNCQNPAFRLINQADYSDISPSDLFVLGRNIYQAAVGNAWEAQSFIRHFSENQSIILEAKLHILNGMAYEIYFNRFGVVRKRFKSKMCLEILQLLSIEEFQMCKNFIASALFEIKDRVVFIPCSENKMQLHILSKESYTETNGDTIYNISSIIYQGHNIMFEREPDQNDDYEGFVYLLFSPIERIKYEIAKLLVAPPDMVILTIDRTPTPTDYFSLPENATLLYQEPQFDE